MSRIFPVRVELDPIAGNGIQLEGWRQLNREQMIEIHRISRDQAQVRSALTMLPRNVLNSKIMVTVDEEKVESDVEAFINNCWKAALSECCVETYKYGLSLMVITKEKQLYAVPLVSSDLRFRVHADQTVEFQLVINQSDSTTTPLTFGGIGGGMQTSKEEEERVKAATYFVVLTNMPERTGELNGRVVALIEGERFASHAVACSMLSLIQTANPTIAVEQKEVAASSTDPNSQFDRNIAHDAQALAYQSARRIQNMEREQTRSMVNSDIQGANNLAVQQGAEHLNKLYGPEGLRTHPTMKFWSFMPARTLVIPPGRSITAAPMGTIQPSTLQDARDGLARDAANIMNLPISMMSDQGGRETNSVSDGQWYLFSTEVRETRTMIVSIVQFAFVIAFPEEASIKAAIKAFGRMPKRQKREHAKRYNQKKKEKEGEGVKDKEKEEGESSEEEEEEDEEYSDDDQEFVDLDEVAKVEVYMTAVVDPALFLQMREMGLISNEGMVEMMVKGHMGVPGMFACEEPIDPITGEPMKDVQDEEKATDEKRYKDSMRLQERALDNKIEMKAAQGNKSSSSSSSSSAAKKGGAGGSWQRSPGATASHRVGKRPPPKR